MDLVHPTAQGAWLLLTCEVGLVVVVGVEDEHLQGLDDAHQVLLVPLVPRLHHLPQAVDDFARLRNFVILLAFLYLYQHRLGWIGSLQTWG